MTAFISLLWAGGIVGMYIRARNQGTGRLTSFFDAVCWPFDIGAYLAEHYTETYKEGLEKQNDRL